MQLPEVTVIGAGRLGGTLLKALTNASFPVKSVFSRSKVSLPGRWSVAGTFPKEKSQVGKLVFLTVSDRAIEGAARQLAALHEDFSSYTVVHCSGSESAEVLASLRKKNALTASFHPLQTFTPQSGPETFQEIYFSMQGDAEAFPMLREVAAHLGARTIEINRKQKAMLHGAAVMASNYLITLLASAVEAGAASGLSENQVKNILFPLVETTLDNTRTGSFQEVLTGPLVRGDIATVENHLDLLQDFPQLIQLYRTMGSRTLDIAVDGGSLSPDQIEVMRELLKA